MGREGLPRLAWQLAGPCKSAGSVRDAPHWASSSKPLPSPPIPPHPSRRAQVAALLRLVQSDVDPQRLVAGGLQGLPQFARQLAVSWSDRVLAS